LKLCVPKTSAAFDGSVALLSEEEVNARRIRHIGHDIPVCVHRVDGNSDALPAVWAVGVPVLPVAVPGELLSPAPAPAISQKRPRLPGWPGGAAANRR